MSTNELSSYLLIAIMSMAIAMAMIPIMMRLAPYIGMVDKPDGRKVHTTSIPRSGGVGIVVGIIIPLFLWLDFSQFTISFIAGCVVLLVFGAWDDAKNIRPLYKFFGQFIAAILVVYYGDLYVHHFPFLGLTEIPEYISKPFTVFAIVGMINALNLSDGLDGLAGGEALISLIAITFLSFQFNGEDALIIAAATIGGIFGFLRFNSHPARIFMGDTGSQTLGFILAVLAVLLTQSVNSIVSPVIALLLLGFPVVDSVVVFYLRARRGDSLVVAAKDHLHHRLLGLGFYHYESVMVIYSIQILLIASAVLLPYESDALLISIYIGFCILLFTVVTYFERRHWSAHGNEVNSTKLLSDVYTKYHNILRFPYHLLVYGFMLFMIFAAVTSDEIPIDIGVSSLVLCVALFFTALFTWFGDVLYKLIMFISVGFAVYLLSTFPPNWLLEQLSLSYIFFAIMTVSAFLTARIAASEQFQITPLDYLVVIMALIVSISPNVEYGSASTVWMIIQIIVLFYVCELIIQNAKTKLNNVTAVTCFALALIAYRGIL